MFISRTTGGPRSGFKAVFMSEAHEPGAAIRMFHKLLSNP
jgi:hypothetical protein